MENLETRKDYEIKEIKVFISPEHLKEDIEKGKVLLQSKIDNLEKGIEVVYNFYLIKDDKLFLDLIELVKKENDYLIQLQCLYVLNAIENVNDQDVKIILNKAREHLRNSQTNEKIMNALLNVYSLKFKKLQDIHQ